jgi:hypothetical protein
MLTGSHRGISVAIVDSGIAPGLRHQPHHAFFGFPRGGFHRQSAATAPTSRDSSPAGILESRLPGRAHVHLVGLKVLDRTGGVTAT